MLLEMKHITKIYGSLKANDDVQLSLNQGEILAVIGENGAGKSTLMKILYGLEQPTSGEIYLNGELQHFHSPHDAMAKKIGMVQQHFMLFGTCTVAENIVYGNEPKKGIFFDRKAAVKTVEALCEKYGLYVDPNAKLKNLPVGMQQRVEILKVLHQNADIIIFDEPTAVLTPQEIDELIDTMKRLAADGKSIIIITHKLHEVMAVADRVIVMRLGHYIKEMNKADTTIEEMSYLMVGRQVVEQKLTEQPVGEEVLTIEDLYYTAEDGKPMLNGLNLHVNAGEVVGIAGVSGNGQSELIQLITGLLKADSGSIKLKGTELSGMTAGQIREAGCACIPEDRYLWGCAKKADLEETALMAHQNETRLSNHGLMKKKAIAAFTDELLTKYDVRNSGHTQKAGELSGGNIQKLIVAREIEQKSPLLIAAEPTRGLDIGAIEFIHGQILKKRGYGDGVLLISSELSEIMTLSDRIYVVYNGRVMAEFTHEEANEREIGLQMMGGAHHAG